MVRRSACFGDVSSEERVLLDPEERYFRGMSHAPSGPPSILEHARLEILHLRLDASDDLWRAFDAALAVSAATLHVRRVGVWFMTATKASLYRARIHDVDHVAETADMILPLERWPAYRDAVLSRRVVAANDARTDPRFAELSGYLTTFGITSMLDVPLFLNGEVCGVVCHEHVGDARTWGPREIDFAVSVADMLSALLEQSMRLSAERRLRASEAAAARAQQLTLAARAAAGIAHDVNTVLQAISVNAEVARATTSDEEHRRAALLSILEDCQRSARILDQLRDLEKPRSTLEDPLDLTDVLEAMRPTLETIIGPHRTLVIDGEPEAFIAATRTDIERIALNLVTNACDATAEGGTVTIVVRRVEADVLLEVNDNGVGLDAEQAERVFEPFYSTKGEGHGGLGLFIVHATSARSGGAVTLQSEVGRGATFVVTWPAARASG